MDQRAAEKVLARVRQRLRQRAPFLDFLLDQVSLCPTEAVPTARVRYARSHFVLDFNPAYLASLQLDQQVALLEHELRHITHRHWERCGEREPLRWNIACDYAINALLPDMPVDALHPPPHLWGRSAEDIYAQLMDQEALPAAACLGFSPESTQEELDHAYRRLLGHAQQRLSPAQVAAELARLAAGDAPGTDGEALTAQGGLGINWPDLVARYRRPQPRRRTLLRPDRRGLSHWGTQRGRRPRVVAVVDTSGSISAALGAAFLAELERLRGHCAALTVLLADAAVQAVLLGEALRHTPWVGRGGTDYAPAITYVNAHLADAELCVYLTDGQGGLPAVSCAIPLVWVVTDNPTFPGRPALCVPLVP